MKKYFKLIGLFLLAFIAYFLVINSFDTDVESDASIRIKNSAYLLKRKEVIVSKFSDHLYEGKIKFSKECQTIKLNLNQPSDDSHECLKLTDKQKKLIHFFEENIDDISQITFHEEINLSHNLFLISYNQFQKLKLNQALYSKNFKEVANILSQQLDLNNFLLNHNLAFGGMLITLNNYHFLLNVVMMINTSHHDLYRNLIDKIHLFDSHQLLEQTLEAELYLSSRYLYKYVVFSENNDPFNFDIKAKSRFLDFIFSFVFQPNETINYYNYKVFKDLKIKTENEKEYRFLFLKNLIGKKIVDDIFLSKLNDGFLKLNLNIEKNNLTVLNMKKIN